MARRIAGPCPNPGCPNRAGQCQQHQLAPRKARGYGPEHDRLRANYQRRMDQGETFRCWRCNTPIDPESWDLGHADNRTKYAGPECPPCNRGAGHRGGG